MSSPIPRLEGTLSLYQTEPALPFFESNASLPNKLVFVPGLTDTIGVVPYLPRLAETVAKHKYSLVQPVLGSSLGGFGTASLEGDAQEIAQLIGTLAMRDDAKDGARIVLMGHSTGCQDAMTFLSKDRVRPDGELIKVAGAILQAPVSDREYFEAKEGGNSEAQKLLAQAKDLVSKGEVSALLPRNAPAKPATENTHGRGNSATVTNPAFTAYRYASLNARGGDDDFFSSDFNDEQVSKAWKPSLSRAPILALMGEEE